LIFLNNIKKHQKSILNIQARTDGDGGITANFSPLTRKTSGEGCLGAAVMKWL
jgi:hypothetical protein